MNANLEDICVRLDRLIRLLEAHFDKPRIAKRRKAKKK
jgi:hypothetical protein